MTFLYTQTDDAREREHVNRIWERLKPGANEQPNASELAAMAAAGGVQ
jgi:gamma-glutamyl:cysteine ligase YbdK (ATP-grasp superfamily)